jgi:hypothetical protein
MQADELGHEFALRLGWLEGAALAAAIDVLRIAALLPWFACLCYCSIAFHIPPLLIGDLLLVFAVIDHGHQQA